MGVHKGQNNFKKVQEEKVDARVRLIENILSKIKKGMVFKDLNSLLVYLNQETTIHRTTLNRNLRYRRIAANFFAAQSGGAGIISEKDTVAAVAQVKSLADNAKIKNLEIEVRRLKLALECAQSPKALESPSVPTAQINYAVQQKATPLSDANFAETAMTLHLLLERLKEYEIGIVLEKGQLIDSVEIGERHVIADALRCRGFVEWLNRQSWIRNRRPEILRSEKLFWNETS